ncbi:hypothetical protein HYPSUDRAFT_128668 [Hypholoma sublateritium FD-334 SS-4]|uniref:CSC1/OSCA1-like 7TM region domain-containing protein n=1 Tax=Hypholoma sublateritium (strain FD-334 SS-4) TaxID=945553 RepID=A0A0D2PKK1_HYPSF|nr:hypothetical protein HYPSUDRAFT_128668 [Hypholoma sublateritium FD-334 SS-4]
MDERLTKRIDANGIQALLNSTQSVEPRAVGIQFLVMTVLSLLTLITFNILRPNNQAVYEPKIKYHANDKHPPHISDSCCGWITPLLRVNEDMLNDQAGLDAVTFLRFMRLMKWLLTLTTVCSCATLIPLDLTYTLSLKPTGYNILTAMTIQYVQGPRLYAHIVVVYFITLALIGLVFHHWRTMQTLRAEWFRSSEYQQSFYARTLYITDVPTRRQSTAGLYGIFKAMNLPHLVTSVYIGKDVGKLPELIEDHNKLVEEFEEVLQSIQDETHQNERSFITVGGCCGMGGRRQDAYQYYTEQLKRTEASVQQYRAQIELQVPENYGFATIASIPLAHGTARELKGLHPKGLTFQLAPNPTDIVWKNMGLSKGERRFRAITGFLLLYLFCFLSLIPLFPIASLANLDSVTSGYIPFLQTWLKRSPITFTLVSGLLPPAVAGIFGSFVPVLMRWLSRYMGASTHTRLDRIVIARYFGFLVISQLVFFTVIGVVFSKYSFIFGPSASTPSCTIQHQTLGLPVRLVRTYVDQSSFWLKWFALSGFLIIWDLAQLFDLIYTRCRTRSGRRTPREIREHSKPPVFSYDIHYSNLLFMGLIGILFAPVAPLVSLAAAIHFWLCSWIYKYQIMFKYITRVETGGCAWNVVINRLLFSGIFMQVVMVISAFQSLKFFASIPPILFTAAFKHYLGKHFANDFNYYRPHHIEELSRSVAHSEGVDIKLRQRYENPALHARVNSPMVHSENLSRLQGIYLRKFSHNLPRGISEKTMSGISDVAMLDGVQITPVNEVRFFDPTRQGPSFDVELLLRMN